MRALSNALLHSRNHRRVGVANHIGAVTGMKIYIAIVVYVPDVGAFAVTNPNRSRPRTCPAR